MPILVQAFARGVSSQNGATLHSRHRQVQGRRLAAPGCLVVRGSNMRLEHWFRRMSIAVAPAGFPDALAQRSTTKFDRG
jgi:hypothetical protein